MWSRMDVLFAWKSRPADTILLAGHYPETRIDISVGHTLPDTELIILPHPVEPRLLFTPTKVTGTLW